MTGGANQTSLIEAQRNYPDSGACDQYGSAHVRPSTADELLDPAWRPVTYPMTLFEDCDAASRAPWPGRPFSALLVAPGFLASASPTR